MLDTLTSHLPILRWGLRYDRADLRGDLIAGVTVAALLVPQGLAYALLAGLPPQVGLYLEHPVILVCQSGGRATTAQGALTAAGKANLRVLEGGIAAWQSAGGPVVTGDQSWSLERQVRGVAGSMVLVSTLVSLRFPRVRLVAGGVGLGLAVSAVTNTCSMGLLLARLPHNRGPRCDLDRVLRDMSASGLGLGQDDTRTRRTRPTRVVATRRRTHLTRKCPY